MLIESMKIRQMVVAVVCVWGILIGGCQKENSGSGAGTAPKRPPLKEEIKLETRNPVLLKLFPENSLSSADEEALLALMKWSDLYELLDYPEKITKIAIQYNEQITDKDLQFLEKFPNLEKLFMKNSSNISDEGMVVLKKLPHLKTLSVYGTKVTEASLPLIAELKNLEDLYMGSKPAKTQNLGPSESPWEGLPVGFTDHSLKILQNSSVKNLWFMSPTDITDDGLQYIAGMKNLEQLTMMSDHITRKGIEEKLLPVLPEKLVHVSISSARPIPENDKPELLDVKKTRLVLHGLKKE